MKSKIDKVEEAVLLKRMEMFMSDNVPRTLDFAITIHPLLFRTIFASYIANVVANLPDDYWEACKVINPCGRVGCNCHLGLVPNAMKLFELLREDHKEVMIEGDGREKGMVE